MRYRLASVLALTVAVTQMSCVTAPPEKWDYTRLRQANPKTVLVVPVINKTVDVDAPDYFLSTIARPVAERGYYVFPVNAVKHLLDDDGLSDANLVHEANPTRLGEIFDADAILYITIERWDAKYVVLTTQVTVEFTYVLKSGRTGDELWRHREAMVYAPQAAAMGHPLTMLITMAVNAALAKAIPNYLPLTQEANHWAVNRPQHGLPAGPYHQEYKKDMERF